MTENYRPPYILQVSGDKAPQIREDLNGAVDRAVRHAMKVGRHGVKVTQHTHTFYTVTLSKDVPYGQTHERADPSP